MCGHQLLDDQLRGLFQCSCVDCVDRLLITVAMFCSQQACLATDDSPCTGPYVTVSLAGSHVAPPAAKAEAYVVETALGSCSCQHVKMGFIRRKEQLLDRTMHFRVGGGRSFFWGRVMEYADSSRDLFLQRGGLKYAVIGLKEIERLVRVPSLSIGSHEQFA